MMVNLKALNSSINIEVLLNMIGYNGERKLQGKDLRIRCPIHKSDNQTSMAIDTVDNIFYCHNCGAKGDLIQLYTDSTGSEQKRKSSVLKRFFQYNYNRVVDNFRLHICR